MQKPAAQGGTQSTSGRQRNCQCHLRLVRNVRGLKVGPPYRVWRRSIGQFSTSRVTQVSAQPSRVTSYRLFVYNSLGGYVYFCCDGSQTMWVGRPVEGEREYTCPLAMIFIVSKLHLGSQLLQPYISMIRAIKKCRATKIQVWSSGNSPQRVELAGNGDEAGQMCPLTITGNRIHLGPSLGKLLRRRFS